MVKMSKKQIEAMEKSSTIYAYYIKVRAIVKPTGEPPPSAGLTYSDAFVTVST